MTLDEVREYLKDAPDNFSERNSEEIRKILTKIKKQAVDANDQSTAKTIWCLEEILDIQDKYIEAFSEIKKEKFYDGWCLLERVDVHLGFLAPHFQDDSVEYHISFIAKHTSQYHSIFPYEIFMSPEILETEKTCNICNKVISLRNPCGHRIGEIYNGEMCGRLVTKAEFLGMAFVKNPVQKYSVPFLSDEIGNGERDHYNYSVVRYLSQRLSSPFHEWDVEWTKRRHPHSRFSDIGRNASCPCGSGKKYKKCCFSEEGVLRPHCLFTFHVNPPEHLMRIEYSD